MYYNINIKKYLVLNFTFTLIIFCFISCTTRVNYRFINYNSPTWKLWLDTTSLFHNYDYSYSSVISNEFMDTNSHNNNFDSTYIFSNIDVEFSDYGYEYNYQTIGYDNYRKYRNVNKFDTSSNIYNDFYILRIMLKLHYSLLLDTNNFQNYNFTKIYIDTISQPINQNSNKSFTNWENKIYEKNTYKLLNHSKGYTVSFEDTLFCSLKNVDSIKIEFEALLINKKKYTPETLYIKKVLSETKGIEFLRDKLPPAREKFDSLLFERDYELKMRTQKRKSKKP